MTPGSLGLSSRDHQAAPPSARLTVRHQKPQASCSNLSLPQQPWRLTLVPQHLRKLSIRRVPSTCTVLSAAGWERQAAEDKGFFCLAGSGLLGG